MRNRFRLCLVLALLLTSQAAESRADSQPQSGFIIYNLGELGGAISQIAAGGRALDKKAHDNRIVLPGMVTPQPGNIPKYSYRHANGSSVHFTMKEVEFKKARTSKEEFNKRLSAAGKDPDAIMQAGIWGLKKALLKEFYRSVDKVLEIDPKNEAALLVTEVKKKLDDPLPESPEAEEAFKKLFKRSTTMRIEKSNHFMLMTDTPKKPENEKKKKNRAKERLDLLEKVYESFILLFHAQDVQLDIPSQRMMVVLFNDYDDFKDYSTGLSPALASASGFWDPISNVSYFFDYGSSDRFELLKTLMTELKKQEAGAIKSRRNPELIRYVQVLELLMDVEKENSDITVVSHECCHQMAGNTGLLPRHVDIPRWVHEGLATYFEAPSDGSWAGIGAVSIERLVYYRALAEHDKQHSNIDFVASDQIFDKAGGIHSNLLHGYAQAWGLTHFLMEKHIKEFVALYRMIGEMPPDVQLNPDILMQIFHRAFGSDLKDLNEEWKSYMRTIKTDMELLEESSK